MKQRPRLISQLAMEYLKINHSRLSRSTVELLERTFRAFTAVIGDMEIEAVDYSAVEDFQASLLTGGRNRVSANIFVKSVRPVFRWAIRRGYLDDDPFQELRLFRIAKGRIRIYEQYEFSEMMLNCTNIWRARLLLAKTAGLRRGEVLNLRIEDVDFERNIVYVQARGETARTWRWQPKDRDIRALPLAEVTAKILLKIIERLPEGQPYLCLTPRRYRGIEQLRRSGRLSDRIRETPDENFSKPFKQILKRSGVKAGTFHDLRRTCITEWLENGLQPHEVMQLAGHSSVETTMRYYTMTRTTLLDKAREASQKVISDRSQTVIGARGLEPPTS